MPISANDIVNKIMQKTIETSAVVSDGGGRENALKRFHVSQTADQLPDFRVRNAFYREELERQIAEKKERERKRKEKEALEEERLLRKIETDQEKLRLEYLSELEQRKILQEEAFRRQQAFSRRLEEIHEVEERKKEVEQERRRQEAIIQKRILELQEAVERRKQEEEERRLLYTRLYEQRYTRYPLPLAIEEEGSLSLRGLAPPPPHPPSEWDYYKRPWNSRDYVHSALHQDDLVLEDVYFEAPLPMLADVYKKLESEKRRIREIVRQRIVQGESS